MKINTSTISYENEENLPVNELKLYLKIDHQDEDLFLKSLLKSCEDYILNNFGVVVSKKTLKTEIFAEKDLTNFEINMWPISKIIDQKNDQDIAVCCAKLITNKLKLTLKKDQFITLILEAGMDFVSEEMRLKIMTHAALLYTRRMELSYNDLQMIKSLYNCFQKIKVTI